MPRFLGKNPQRKVVRAIPHQYFSHIVSQKAEKIEKIIKKEEVKENKEVNTNKEMADARLEKIETIMGTKAPKRRVKREKKDRGLIERTGNSEILLTEDNKILLND